MDRYKAVHTLQKINKTRFMVFAHFFEEIPYYLAVPDDDSGLVKGLLDDYSCFKNHIDNSDVDSLLVKYIPPIKVTTTF